MEQRRIVAVIPARGGSKGIPGKNIAPFCGRPLLAWTIKQARALMPVYVSTDCPRIVAVAAENGANIIHRPRHLAGDEATSESAWLHAAQQVDADLIVGMQATSPVRETRDIAEALALYRAQGLDSLFTACEADDRFLWREGARGLESFTYDWRARRRRQDCERRYVENGSFYIFTPEVLSRGNRLGGRIGAFLMAKHKGVQIDTPEDMRLAEVIMRGYGYAG